MTYKINGVELSLQPTTGEWVVPDAVGITGDGHPVYPGVMEFVMRWGVMSPSQFNQIYGFYMAQGITGTSVVDLPAFGSSGYVFYSYSGCILSHPAVGEYFAGHYLDVELLVSNIVLP